MQKICKFSDLENVHFSLVFPMKMRSWRTSVAAWHLEFEQLKQAKSPSQPLEPSWELLESLCGSWNTPRDSLEGQGDLQRGGGNLIQEKPSEPSPGRGRGGFLRILRIRGLKDSDLQVVPPNVSTRLEA